MNWLPEQLSVAADETALNHSPDTGTAPMAQINMRVIGYCAMICLGPVRNLQAPGHAVLGKGQEDGRSVADPPCKCGDQRRAHAGAGSV
ncbi:hypothetical protein MRS75_18695 [Rhizobiaceae bacterium n36]|uniref:Uncharacterized protein n=1 Tax=Ferirhizobium litorale TaxID=2927786 RepID=A0AAE3QID9_9HYPH|nr:hypothetical protein [Fererhizobium litorale]